MKSKRSRKEYSSDDETDEDKGWSIEKKSCTDASSDEEVSRKSKKRKKRRASTSDSDSDDSDVDSHKKRKHKKKKRKHSKKKRKDSSDSDSDSEEEASSPEESEDNSPVIKKKHKHKHKHSSKHSKKRRQSPSEHEYSGREDREESIEAKSSRSQRGKIKSVCLGRAPSAEQIVSEEEDYARDTRTKKTDDSRHRNDQYKPRHHQDRQSNRPHHETHQDTRRHHDEQRVPYRSEDSRTHDHAKTQDHSRELPRQYVESYKTRPDPRERQPDDRRQRHDVPRHAYGNSDQYYNEGKRDDGANTGYNRYGDEIRKTNHYDRKYTETADPNRYGGTSNQGYNKERRDYRDNNPQYGERYEDNNRSQDYNRKPNYQHKDNRIDKGNYERKDYQSRGDQRSNNNNNSRYNQDRGDYAAGGSNNHRYERDGHSSKDISVRESSASKPRDVKPERPDRMDSRDRKPRTDYRREDRESESGASRGRDKMARFSDNRRSPEEEKDYEWGKKDVKQEKPQEKGEKGKPDFALSGKLTEDANTVNGVVLKYTEPAEARKPKRRWRFYPFKGDKALPILYIHRQSCFLLGRDRKVADIPLDHPSVSKQHAALQYRLVPFTRDDGSTGKRIRPYIIDLGSANGTFVNNKKIDAQKYVELLERDVVKFGFSQREYVLLHENSREDGTDDDDVKHSGGEERSHLKMEKD